MRDRDAIILSIPFDRVPELAGLLSAAPEQAVVIDTSNYYPHLGGRIEDEQVESVRNAELLGRPLVKAWNAALAETQRTKGVPAGTPDAARRSPAPRDRRRPATRRPRSHGRHGQGRPVRRRQYPRLLTSPPGSRPWTEPSLLY